MRPFGRAPAGGDNIRRAPASRVFPKWLTSVLKESGAEVRNLIAMIAVLAALAAHAGEAKAQPGAAPSVSVRDLRWSEADYQELAMALSEAYSHGLPDMTDAARRIADPDRDPVRRRQDAADHFRTYAQWLRYGMLDPETLEARRLTRAERAQIDLALRWALEDQSVYESLAALAPPVRDYEALRMEMARRMIRQPVQPGIAPGPALRPGDEGVRVDQLRARLAAEGLLSGPIEMGAPYDARLDTAVRRFQGRVNLAPTGVADRDTLRQLNISPDERLAQLRANLEQRRWRSRDLGRRHIWVNLADFSLEAWEDGELARRHQVMVGTEASSTPEFSEEMRYLVLNPWWNIPGPSGSVRFRSIRRNPGLVAQNGFRIYDRAGQPVSVWELDWSRWGNDWPYRISQPPGPSNPMGEIKFIFPNRHNIYIHDTIERDRFIRTRRDFSAGCIRVQDPFALAAWVLQEQDEAWPLSRIEAVAAGREPTVVWLDNRLPVHIAYWTVVGDPEGGVRFLNDLYDRDERVIAAVDRAWRHDGRPPPLEPVPSGEAAPPALD